MGAAPQVTPPHPTDTGPGRNAPPDEIVAWARGQIRWERRLERLRAATPSRVLKAVNGPGR